MKDFSKLIEKVEANDEEIFWLGRVDDSQINILEIELKTKLPSSFKEFLSKYGGGGVVENEISGIESNDATLKTGGTVLRNTLECRQDYDMPEHLVVIFYQYQELAWCLDTAQMTEDYECPVVSYDIFSKIVSNKIAENFELFFQEYLELRAGIDN